MATKASLLTTEGEGLAGGFSCDVLTSMASLPQGSPHKDEVQRSRESSIHFMSHTGLETHREHEDREEFLLHHGLLGQAGIKLFVVLLGG